MELPLLDRSSFRTALAASGIAGLAATAGAAVRVLPWLLDPAVTWQVAAPFARSILALAVEAAVFVGWPVGWALALVGVVERGEGRVFETLGERPARTVLRLAPQAAAWCTALALVSFVGGRDASAPGRVVDELLQEARLSCRGAAADGSGPTERAVPFADATWLCAPGQVPHLVGRGPGPLSRIAFTATDAHVTGDLRRIDLADAKVVLGQVHLRAGGLTLRGLTPWAHASNLSPAARALLLALTGGAASLLAAYLTLRRMAPRRLGAIAVGAAGPLVALAVLRALERHDARPAWSCVVLPLSLAATFACALVLSRLPRWSATASR
jgi:hypothetical protein